MLRMILREGVGLALIGCAIGVAAAFIAGRSLAGFLYGVAPWDPATPQVKTAVVTMSRQLGPPSIPAELAGQAILEARIRAMFPGKAGRFTPPGGPVAKDRRYPGLG